MGGPAEEDDPFVLGQHAAYVSIEKISELETHRKKFNGKIIGIDPGAGIMKTSEAAIELYGLDFKLLASSGPAMTAALKDAIRREQMDCGDRLASPLDVRPLGSEISGAGFGQGTLAGRKYSHHGTEGDMGG
jgi:hypothetical protein